VPTTGDDVMNPGAIAVLFVWSVSCVCLNQTNRRNQSAQIQRSLLATSSCKHLPLLGDTAAAITEFDGCASHRIDAGSSSLDHRSTVSTDADDWMVRPTILSQHGAAFLCSDERAGCRQLT